MTPARWLLLLVAAATLAGTARIAAADRWLYDYIETRP